MKATTLTLLVLALSSAAPAAGPVLFTKGVMEDVKPTDAPATGRAVERIDLIACPGEFEPFSLAVRGGADGSWALRCSDLRAGEGGGVIPASAVEIAPLRFQAAEGHLGKYGHVKDYILQPRAGALAVKDGRTSWLWLTVHVPPGAAPGRYRGALTLTSREGAGRVELPVAVEVLPLRLAPVPGVRFALLYTVAFGQYHNAASRTRRRPAALKLYRLLKDHGMTCIAPKCSDWPYKPGHFEGLEACMAAAAEAGFSGPVVWNMGSLVNARKGGRAYAHFDGKCDNWDEKRDLANLAEIVREVRRRGREKGWPEIVFLTADEPGTQTDDLKIRDLRMRSILPKTLKAIADAGARGCSTISEPVDEKHNRRWVRRPDELRRLWDLSRRFCHVRIYAYGYPQGKTNLAFEKADCAKRGHEMWFYHNPASMGRDRCRGRVYFGLWGWRVGAQGLTAWTYPGGRTVQLELIREGIDDFKYLAALERLAADESRPAPARQAARAFLDALRAAVKLDANGCVADWAEAARQATGFAGGGPKRPDFAAFKRRLAALLRPLARGGAPRH